MDLETLHKEIDALRNRALFDTDAAGMDPIAETELVSAIAFLDLAHMAAKRADLLQTRALAQSPYRL